MPNFQQVYVGLPPRTIERLDALALERGADRSELMREFIQDGLDDVDEDLDRLVERA